jgi:hypothetical protein
MPPRRNRTAPVLFGVLILGFLTWFYWPAFSHHGGRATTRAPVDPALQPPATPPPAAYERSTLADQLNAAANDIRGDLQLVSNLVAIFRANFPRAGNPVGTNAEITAALTGRNPLGLSLVPRDHPAINAAGELCDRWGTPFFFHALSAAQMEIRSAGPDRKLWTGDDVIWTN